MPQYRIIPSDAPCFSQVANQGDRTLCITVPEMVECGVSEIYLRKILVIHRNGNVTCWPHHKEGNTIYLHYDGLRDTYKDKIQATLMHGLTPDQWYEEYGRLGDIENKIMPATALRAQDESYLQSAILPGGKKLPPKAIKEASEQCMLLGAISRLKTKMQVKLAGWPTVGQFYDDMIFLIDRRGIKLPQNYFRLRERVRLYEQKGAESCVDLRMQGNKSAAKVYSEEQVALLRTICGRGASYNARQIGDLYNLIAEKKGWQTITQRSALNYLREYQYVIKAGRDGSEAFRGKIGMQIRRNRPTEALSFWSLDGWTAELYYQKDITVNGKTTHTYMNRMTVVVVIDACNDFPVGYAIGEGESVALITAAVKDAIDYVHDTLGDSYRPYQIQSDHYGIKSMSTIYDNVSEYFTPARVKNAKSKPVERYFKSLNELCQLHYGNQNWSGFGITSKRSHQPNIDILSYNKKLFPDRKGVIEQIESLIGEQRKNKMEMWLKAWKRMPVEDRLTLSRENYLLNFGYRNERTIRMHAGCLEPTILGEVRAYDSFDLNFRKDPLKSWTVHWDDRDLSTILVTDDTEKERYLLEAVHYQPMSLRDRKPGDYDALMRVDDFNKNVLEKDVIATIAHDEELVRTMLIQDRISEGFREATMLTDSRGQHKAYLQHSALIKSDEDMQPEIDEKIGSNGNKTTFEQSKNSEKEEKKRAEKAYEEYAKSKIDFNKFREL